MIDIRTQRVTLAGRVIEDLTHAPLPPGRYTAQMTGAGSNAAIYKPDGFFAFCDLPDGTYHLTLTGTRFAPQTHEVTLPVTPLLLGHPGDDELIVIATAVNGGDSRITFDSVTLNRPIRAGALVRAQGVSTTLTADLDVGPAIQARLDDVTGISPGDIVRIVRGDAFRLRFDPYATLPIAATRLAGKVTRSDAPEIALEGAQVRLTRVNGTAVTTTNVAGVRVVTAAIGSATRVLGTRDDTEATTNANGDFNLYFRDTTGWTEITLRVTLDGFQPRGRTRPVVSGQRNVIDVQLTPL